MKKKIEEVVDDESTGEPETQGAVEPIEAGWPPPAPTE